MNPSRPAGLSEAERELLRAELAEIAAELTALQCRAAQIADRVGGSGAGAASSERVDRSA